MGKPGRLADIDGEWEVIDVLDVRGPPEQRFWKLWWKPYPRQEKVEAERSEQDDGSWRHGWQPHPCLSSAMPDARAIERASTEASQEFHPDRA